MNDIQLGDIITPFNEHYNDRREYEILHIPTEPGIPWVVREVENKRKWRLWTAGPISITTYQ